MENIDGNRMFFFFVHRTANILTKVGTCYLEHSDNMNCSLLVNPRHTDESWEVRLYIYVFTKVIIIH